MYDVLRIVWEEVLQRPVATVKFGERYILVIVHKSHPTKVARLQPRSQSIVDQAILTWREDHCVD